LLRRLQHNPTGLCSRHRLLAAAAAFMTTTTAAGMTTTATTAAPGLAAAAATTPNLTTTAAATLNRGMTCCWPCSACRGHCRRRARYAGAAYGCSAATGIVAAIRNGSAAAAIVSAPIIDEAMSAPAVAIAPAGPGAHAQEDAVVEVARPVKSIGGAGVG